MEFSKRPLGRSAATETAGPVMLYITLNAILRSSRQALPFQTSSGFPALFSPTFN